MKFGLERKYNKAFKNEVLLWEVIKLEHHQKLIIRFISKNSNNRQGIRIAIDAGKGKLEINGITSKEFNLWEDTAPKEVICIVNSDVGLLSIYNIWEDKNGRNSQADSSGMIVEIMGNKTIYKCNDFGFVTNFDKLVFEVEVITSPE